MSLSHALLGLITYRPSTGYELKATFESSIHFFWNATLPQIYRTLNDMKEKGWLESTVEHQDGRPSRKIYRATDGGRKELLRWLAEPPETAEHKHPLLIKVFFGGLTGGEELSDQIRQWREHHARMIERYDTEVLPLIAHYAALVGRSDDGAYWALTLDYGRRHARSTVEWCDEALRRIALMRKQEAPPGPVSPDSSTPSPGDLPRRRT